MFAQIIPDKKFPREISFFDYLIPKDMEKAVKIGQIVEIPFRKTKMNGVIFNIGENSPAGKKLKQIARLTGSALPEYQIKLLKWMSLRYVSSLPTILQLMMPPIPKKSFAIDPPRLPEPRPLKIKRNKIAKIRKASEEVLGSDIRCLLHYDEEAAKDLLLMKIISEELKKDKQSLIILPQIGDVYAFSGTLRHYFPKERIAIFHAGLSKTAIWDYWRGSASGEIKIIIGTRSAIFSPLKYPGVIIINNEHSSDLKQYDQNPRYDARDTAVQAAKLLGCRLIMASNAPRTQTYYKCKTGEFKLVELADRVKHVYHTINMRSTFKNELSPIFSQRVIEKIASGAAEGKRSVLFIGRKGMNTSASCQDCGFTEKCPTCGLPMDIFSADEGEKLRCPHCNFIKDNIVSCPQCHGTNIKNFGAGSQKIENEIKKIFPGVPAIRIDKDEEKKLENIDPNDYQIIIGTHFMLKEYWNRINDPGLLAVIAFDRLFNVAEYDTDEKVYRLLKELQQKALSKGAELMVQTFNPENIVLKAINDHLEFYNKQITERRSFNYPPFKLLIKLIAQNKDKAACASEAREIYDKIKERPVPSMQIMDPYPYYRSKLRGNFRYNILIKIREDELPELKLKEIVPADWLIDIGPDSLL